MNGKGEGPVGTGSLVTPSEGVKKRIYSEVVSSEG